MGLLGSAMGRAFAGAGNAAADIANRYIDKEIQLAKAQAMADIQRESNIKQEGQLDALRNAPERIARDRTNKVGDIEATGRARNAVDLEGKRAEASDQTLVDGRINSENRYTRETSQTKIEAETAAGRAKMVVDIERAKAILPLEVKKAYAVADASASASAKHRQEPGAELAAKLAIVEKTLGRPLKDDEKLGLLGLSKAVSNDLATVTENEYDAEGRKIKSTERKVPAGQSGQGSATDPIKAAMDAARGAKPQDGAAPGKQQDSLMGAAGRLQPTRRDPITNSEMTRQQWDRKYGKGDFDKLYGKGEPALKAF